MKNLTEIIEEVKSGKSPEYEELRYAVLVLSSLLHFEANAIRQLYGKELEGKYNPKLFGLEWEANEGHRRRQLAYNKSPKEWIGWENDPQNIEYLQRRKQIKDVFSNIVDKIEQKKRDG